MPLEAHRKKRTSRQHRSRQDVFTPVAEKGLNTEQEPLAHKTLSMQCSTRHGRGFRRALFGAWSGRRCCDVGLLRVRIEVRSIGSTLLDGNRILVETSGPSSYSHRLCQGVEPIELESHNRNNSRRERSVQS
jgi:hypothetical protein